MIAARNIDPRKYGRLLSKALPLAIESDEERQRAHRLVRELMKNKRRSAEEDELLKLLATLIQEYEQRTHDISRMRPHRLLRAVMDEAGLRQRDLLDIFGTRSVVSEVLSGKRAITKPQARALATRFRISPSAFIAW
ncbi:MAG TPA: transcriptional regulator [Blastocatellia bacterium]|nr:transcriptional regulator [Blastocatellia bacterium]